MARSRVRVLVREGVKRVALRSAEPLALRPSRGRARDKLGARVDVEYVDQAQVRLSVPGERPFSVSLPCTLLAVAGGAGTDVDTSSYRGALVLIPGDRGFSCVNVVDIEEYLRGVVPLELGVRRASQMEALKAQAVAARTYACRKMCEHAAEPFDLYATVTDQVYGGVGSADSTADRAIRETRGLVGVYRDSLIHAYYHSTCGGKTAAVNDVWDQAPQPYLVSVDDSGPGGRPWCAASRYATWVSSWTRGELSSILARYGADAACGGTVGGSVGRVKVEARTPCGRVARLRVESSRGSLELCGDKVRFGLRRGDAGNPILPSARFEVASGESRGVLSLKGSGYGHGIGMCQMGALARAEAGQSFAEILQAYYPGIELRSVVPAGGPAVERTR
jgi:stage II sporulation protein D